MKHHVLDDYLQRAVAIADAAKARHAFLERRTAALRKAVATAEAALALHLPRITKAVATKSPEEQLAALIALRVTSEEEMAAVDVDADPVQAAVAITTALEKAAAVAEAPPPLNAWARDASLGRKARAQGARGHEAVHKPRRRRPADRWLAKHETAVRAQAGKRSRDAVVTWALAEMDPPRPGRTTMRAALDALLGPVRPPQK